jgi:hypothetical protein
MFKVNYRKYSGYTDTQARAKIQEAIEQYLIDYGRLGSTIKYSDLIYAIESLSEIDWCYMQMKKSTDVSYSTQNIEMSETEFPDKADISFLTLTAV